MSFRSLSKLHLHCLQRCRAQFLEADVKAEPQNQLKFASFITRGGQSGDVDVFVVVASVDLQLGAVVNIERAFLQLTRTHRDTDRQSWGSNTIHNPHGELS